MEKAKPSKKKAYSKNRTTEMSGNWRKAGKDHRHSSMPREEVLTLSKRPLQQSESRLADLDEIWQDTNVGQDFEALVNVPLSTAGHFVFKSEKNWTLDASKYDEYFSVDVKNLATIIECIPFNEYVNVDKKYFTNDELTNINNTAEQARRAYDLMLQSLRKDKVESIAGDCDQPCSSTMANDLSSENDLICNTADKHQDPNVQSNEDDLDFLLSLKEPVRPHCFRVAPTVKTGLEESKTKNIPTATKSIDLEKWLDFVLDD